MTHALLSRKAIENFVKCRYSLRKLSAYSVLIEKVRMPSEKRLCASASDRHDGNEKTFIILSVVQIHQLLSLSDLISKQCSKKH